MTRLNRYRFWIGAAILLTAIKLWLTRGQGIFVIGSAAHDDLLFVELAKHLINGEWLGPYNELTLAKGSFYPLFIAAAFITGIPLFMAQHLFYAAACALFTRSLKPALKSAGARFAIYAILLWNPMTYDLPDMGRVLRQQVSGPLVLLMFAGLIAMYLRRNEAARRMVPWTFLLGLSSGAFYLTREGNFWILPSMLLLASAIVIVAWRESRAQACRAASFLALGLMVASLPLLTVSALNKHYYGWFGTCEFRAPEFQNAYGALTRVEVGPDIPLVPVTREAREAIARVSPKFAELQKQFDGGLADGWAGASEFFTHIPASEGQIGGGWFMWAVRDATARAGYAHNAAEAMSFYEDLANEINEACDQGLLPAGPHRSGFMPRWRSDQALSFVRNLSVFTDFIVRFSHFSALEKSSEGSPEQLQLFRDITRERICPALGELGVVGADRYLLNLAKVNALQRIGKTTRLALPYLIYSALFILFIRSLWMLYRRTWAYPLTVALAAGGACAASVLIHALIETTSFPVLSVTSFAPIYPLLLVFVCVICWDLVNAWQNRSSPTTTKQVAPVPKETVIEAGAGVDSKRSRWLPWLTALGALLPFLIWYSEFRKLFWFGDDFFLLDQMAQMGLLKWSTLVFSENFVPLFKILWGNAVIVFGGTYLAMLWLLWLTHALNTYVFTRLLQRARFPQVATLFSVLVFAISPVNIETLGWSVQWSAVLATSFLLIGLWWLELHREKLDGFSWRIHLPLFLFATASACSFSRGVLTGAVMALGIMLPVLINCQPRALLKKWPSILLCLIPAVAVALVIKLNSSGNHQHMDGHWIAIMEYGMSYFLLNPLHSLLGETSLHPAVIMSMAAIKLGVIVTALMFSRNRVRHILLLLLAYDIGNSLLLGIGRYHTGFLASLSSRYQYSSLIATLPFAGILISCVLAGLRQVRIRQGITAALLILLAGYCLKNWPATLAGFTDWRGTEVRELIAAPTTTDPSIMVPTLDFMHIERGKALQRAYDLH